MDRQMDKIVINILLIRDAYRYSHKVCFFFRGRKLPAPELSCIIHSRLESGCPRQRDPDFSVDRRARCRAQIRFIGQNAAAFLTF